MPLHILPNKLTRHLGSCSCSSAASLGQVRWSEDEIFKGIVFTAVCKAKGIANAHSGEETQAEEKPSFSLLRRRHHQHALVCVGIPGLESGGIEGVSTIVRGEER